LAVFSFVVAVQEGGSVRYLLLSCGDESAAGHPAAAYGTIEIRPFSS
jgi:hypothetical protein